MNPLLTPAEQAHIDTVRRYQHSPDTHGMDSTVSSLPAILGRIDWDSLEQLPTRKKSEVMRYE